MILLFSLIPIACNETKTEDTEDTHVVEVYNATPEAEITSHSDGDVLNVLEEHTFVGEVFDANDELEDLIVVWSSNTRELCEESAPAPNATTTCTAMLSQDETEITLTVTDNENDMGTATITVSFE